MLAYSSETWLGMLAYMMDIVEKSFKDMVYCILNIPEKSNYSAVLLELGLLKMKHKALWFARRCWKYGLESLLGHAEHH